ncbi:carboxypeptidase regulatory-like domain-containing protein [Acidipila sp. EB88]|uniref:TonB-dependent receptor n=1 Tax=Acidipila sp. EB88 TaxID=2305226 RepID=UPI000F5F8FBA|nr:carboxypeptidase regulatory-like domain-containing protein [Acidipila sp. EB88]RRA49383.1 TonB-dependent receptor [Acidipila sp. EB88]
MKRSLQYSCCAVTIATALMSSAISGQEISSTKGGLAGEVTDSSGASIPGATITIKGGEGSRTVTADGAGHWSIGSLTPGLYTVSVQKEGFQSEEAKNLEVVINRSSNVSLQLKPGAVAETVQVDATSTQIDTGSTAISTNLTEQFYQQVPMARNVGSLFSTAPGVVNSGGAGTSNPSIGGASGLENEYFADGVNIGDAGYGGLGTYSPTYGSLGTGINLTFIQEVQVKTGAFEPRYGLGDGGVIQIVTKSGGTTYHGAVASFFAPAGMSATQRYADNYFNRVNVRGRVFSQPQYDASAEFGGYVPGHYLHDKLFFYGAYNPALNQFNWIAPTAVPGDPPTLSVHGPYTNNTTVNSWAGKVSFRPSDNLTIDASAFGDPSRTNAGYGPVDQDTSPYYPNVNLTNDTGFSRWNYGSRSESVHITGTPTATWDFDIAASRKNSHFTETGLENVFQVTDYSGAVQTSTYTAQGLGFTQNPNTRALSFSIDSEKTVGFFGQQHSLSVGYNFVHNIYDLTKAYSGGSFTFPTANAAGGAVLAPLAGSTASGGFDLYAVAAGDNCPVQYCPLLNGTQVYLDMDRGLFSNPVVPSGMNYNVVYGNDNWSIGHRVTVNAGIRWEQEQLSGIAQTYIFNDNWSPRLGINFDPKGDRKSKVFFNWGRYTQSLTQDSAIRALGQEEDIYHAHFTPQTDGNGNVLLNANGTANPIVDAAHLISGIAAAGAEGSNISISSAATPELIQPGTKLNFEEEYVGGIEKQFNGFVLSARYTDRRLLRVIEDQAGASPEGALSGFVPQYFALGNPSATSDYFVNEVETPYTFNAALPNNGAPANCPQNYNTGYGNKPFMNSAGQVAGPGGVCGNNPATVALPTPDGKPDGEPNPRRHYQAVELEVNKNFSHNFLLRVNYRWAKLFGNYEGAYRNDNGQSDPSISSLFDFTQGALGMLGDQYTPGYLNTDRRQVGNLFGSYVVPSGFAKKLTAGAAFRASSGQPITNFGAHPVYTDPGEIPLGVRGSLGRNASNYQLDLHTDYPVALGENRAIKLTFDTFNVTNSRSLTAVDQDSAQAYGVPNQDYLKPLGFQRAFYGRGSIRFEF